MMEQAEVQAGVGAPKMPVGRALSDEVRASLDAIRVAREAAHERARRQTMKTRLWFALVVGAVGVATVTVGPRVLRWRHGRVQAAAPVIPAAAAIPAPSEPVAPAPSAPAAAAPIASVAAAPVPEPALAPAEKPSAQPSPAATETKSRGGGALAEGCDAGLVHTTPWLLSPDACALAFEADPSNAALALGIAHAEHVRGHFAESAQWANRALALEPKAAEAYILVARAEAQSGRAEEAQAAYRRYLELAPRGWHQAEARAGGRRGR